MSKLREPRQENPIYLKVPYINEQIKRRTLQVIHRAGLKNINTHFITGKPSSKIFTPSKYKQCCPTSCETCKISEKTNQCLTKNCVYRIKCLLCDSTYIGETSCTIGTRIKEHLRTKGQTVYNHLSSHNIDPKSGNHINWTILHNNLRYNQQRKVMEAIVINQYSNNLMNGCIGRTLDI